MGRSSKPVYMMLNRSRSHAQPKRTLGPWLALALALPMLGGQPAAAVELRELFAPDQTPKTASAAEMLERAYANLFGKPSVMSIETVRTTASGEVIQRASFRVLRRSASDGTRMILTETLAPAAIAGTRVLQIEHPRGDDEAHAFLPSTDMPPMETSYRMSDPFLCTLYDRAQAGARGAPQENATSYEIIGNQPLDLFGERVHVITLRSLLPGGFERTELTIADSDYAILEYQYFTSATDPDAAVIARARRADMVDVDGRVLPRALLYEDFTTGEEISVRVEHAALPASVPNMIFDPRMFHRVRGDWDSNLKAPAPEVEPASSAPKP